MMTVPGLALLHILAFSAVAVLGMPSFSSAGHTKSNTKVWRWSTESFHGKTWQEKAANVKQAMLWLAITNNSNSGGWPSSFAETELFIESMDTTFDSVSDDMPYQGLFDLQQRPKLIHSVGCVASATFLPNDNRLNYTGLFQGAHYGFIRFSTATSYSSTPQSFVPAISFKFLRSGIPSANFMGMYSLEGSDSFNFFTHDLTNHPPTISLNASYALRALGLKFETASNFPTMLGLSDFATYDENGSKSATPQFPFRLVFQAQPALKKMFSTGFTTNDLCSMIDSIAPGDIYNVYAEAIPNAPPQLIGVISTLNQPTSSLFGDQLLFCEHKRMEDDFLFHPEWQAAATAIVAKQASEPYFNGFADLP